MVFTHELCSGLGGFGEFQGSFADMHCGARMGNHIAMNRTIQNCPMSFSGH